MLIEVTLVNLHAYLRTTFDVDLLVREGDAERWLSFAERGHAIFTAPPISSAFALPSTRLQALPVDLMLADSATYRKIRSESHAAATLGIISRWQSPSPLHLIAMKLHARNALGV